LLEREDAAQEADVKPLRWEPWKGSHALRPPKPTPAPLAALGLARWCAAGEGAREARGVGRLAGRPEVPAGGKAGGLPTRLALGVLLASVGCAMPYAYSFHSENRDARPSAKPNQREVLDDADVRAEILVDPTDARAILLDLTNKTDQVLQVEWAKITMTGSDGSSTSPRPHVDLGWILPGTTMSARLVPFALPPSGDRAAGYQGSRFELVVPMIVRREPKSYRYSFVVDVRPI
jgi:hypothetical protein